MDATQLWTPTDHGGRYSHPIEIQELVSTILLTPPALAAARKTDSVPSTAGRITSSSFLTWSAGNGLAMCWMYVQPFTALGTGIVVIVVGVKSEAMFRKKKPFGVLSYSLVQMVVGVSLRGLP